ncbi:sugar transferase [Chryseobacterium zhengzhouense]|uniref:Sugar transferase n=1 Tax=Chryseobacterium zhengzhouense TaxID=1636086 RepID=A0ABW2M470_9FLAO
MSRYTNLNITKPKPRCLFLNVSDISMKLFSGTKLNQLFKPLIYDFTNDGKNISEYVQRLNIKYIVLDTTTVHVLPDNILLQIIELRLSGIKVYDANNFYEFVNKRIPLVKFQTNSYLADDIFSINLKPIDQYCKRLLDLFTVFCASPFAIFLIAFGVVTIILTSKGPAFFRQVRVGKNGVPFTIYKLRTMRIEHDAGFTTADDKRITPVGKFLRKTKIDELPQLFNILNGNMSLIGPRPERPEFVKESIAENAFFDLRHIIKPGVTGWAQVNLPKATPKDNQKKLEYDLYYIKKYSFFLDIKIIFETIKVVLTMNSH